MSESELVRVSACLSEALEASSMSTDGYKMLMDEIVEVQRERTITDMDYLCDTVKNYVLHCKKEWGLLPHSSPRLVFQEDEGGDRV